jgi:hypothetical protein
MCSWFFPMNFFLVMVVVLKRDEDILVFAVFGEVDAHAFESVSGEERDERGIFLFHLISDEFKALSHRVLYHLLLRLLHLLETLVQIREHLRQERRVRFIK